MNNLPVINVVVLGFLTAMWKQGTWPNAIIKFCLLMLTLANLFAVVKP